MHHTLGNGEYDFFRRMTEPVVGGHAVMTPQNVAYETERLIAEALYHRRPVYMAFPADLANQPVLGDARPVAPPRSDPASLEAAAAAIVDALSAAESACILPGILVARTGLQSLMQNVVDASGLPFATMFMAKSVLDEQQPAYVGMYDGAIMSESVREFVEGCDRILTVGVLLSDFNTGAFTARLDPARTISISHHRAQVDGERIRTSKWEICWHCWHAGCRGAICSGTKLVLSACRSVTATTRSPPTRCIRVGPTSSVRTISWPPKPAPPPWGSASPGCPKVRLSTIRHYGVPVGWATPAAVGAAVAAPDRRVVLVTGDGSHQLTAQEICQFGRLGLKPVVFVLNNAGYLIERLLCKDPSIAYNDIAPWRYAELPRALGCDGWFTARVTTCGELDHAMEQAARGDAASYIEVVTDAYRGIAIGGKAWGQPEGALQGVIPSDGRIEAIHVFAQVAMLRMASYCRDRHRGRERVRHQRARLDYIARGAGLRAAGSPLSERALPGRRHNRDEEDGHVGGHDQIGAHPEDSSPEHGGI